MPSFATFADLGGYLRQDIGPDDVFAQLALDAATEAIQSYTRQTIFEVVDDVVKLDGTGSDTLLLPQQHVTAVSEVIIDIDKDTPQTLLDPSHGSNADYDFTESGILVRREGQTALFQNQFYAVFGVWPDRRRSVQVTYTHGYDPVPANVRMICLVAAARAYAQDGAAVEATGTFNITYAGQPGMLTDDEKRALDFYRDRR